MLTLHTALSPEALVQTLAQLLSAPQGDPLAAELVAVPTRGIERWLAQRLASTLGARSGRGDGVCANVHFPSPSRLLGQALATAAGIDPESDPWREERLVWAVLEAIERNLEQSWMAPLARHYRERPEARLRRAQKLARLYVSYGLHRPQLIRGWAAGDDQHWQAQLWRQLRAALPTESPAERLPGACARIRADAQLLTLPPRLFVYGLTRLPSAELQLLEAISGTREVHLLLTRASLAQTQRNPLLRSWGREHRALWDQLRELRDTQAQAQAQATPAGGAQLADLPPAGSPPADTPRAAARPAASLLGAIQAAIREDSPPPGPPLPGEPDTRLALDSSDHSLRVHACHGRARQVEVLREAILHRLQQDPTLEPRDVIVMCPDVEAFAPLIEASFGTAGELDDQTRTLQVRIADRALRQSNPLLAAISRLLELPDARLTASEVLDLADTEPVRRRFRFDDDELATIREWVAAAGINWGLDAAARARYRLEQVQAGTWAAGMRRLLLGAALSAQQRELFCGVLGAGAAGSATIDLLGRFAELLDRLGAALTEMTGSHSVQQWAATIGTAADTLTAVDPREGWQRRELDEILAQLSAHAPQAGPHTQLSLSDLRVLLHGRLAGRPTSANFRTGQLTVCTLHPMRAIPHRVVCLLGLDDGVFPRRPPHDGDNLLALSPQPGDRDPRAEDRQLLLDALLAAGEALIITYSGHDERTNAPRPPAVPVGELLDVVDATARTPGGAAREQVRVDHPLQSFDPRNFSAGLGPSPAGGGPWGFDRSALEGALALSSPRHPPAPFLEQELPAPELRESVSLDELVAFVRRPARAFLRQRLEISLLSAEDELHDALPTELDGPARWGVGQRLLEALVDGVDARAAALLEIARGTLPPGALGEPVIREALPQAQLIARHALAHARGLQARALETNLTLADGTRLTGTVSGVRGHVLLTLGYARLSPRHRLAAWVRFLALNAAHPELPLEAVTLGRAPGGEDTQPAVVMARIPQLGATAAAREQTALQELERIAALRAQGMRRPLPLPCLTAAAYAGAALRAGEDPVAAANQVWRSRFGSPGEEDEPEHRLVFADGLQLDALAPLAVALWRPLLEREAVQRG